MYTGKRQVYAIYPYDEQGKVAGVYVGSSEQLNQRLHGHLTDKRTHQEFHQLMRDNGFTFQILAEANGHEESHIEYDWIDFFIKANANVYNDLTRDGDASKVSTSNFHPVWNGTSVVWALTVKREPLPLRPFTEFVKSRGLSMGEVAKGTGMNRAKFRHKQNGNPYRFTLEELQKIKSMFPDVSGETIEELLFAKAEDSK